MQGDPPPPHTPACSEWSSLWALAKASPECFPRGPTWETPPPPAEPHWAYFRGSPSPWMLPTGVQPPSQRPQEIHISAELLHEASLSRWGGGGGVEAELPVSMVPAFGAFIPMGAAVLV